VEKERLALAALRVVAGGGASEVPELAAALASARGPVAVAAAEALGAIGSAAAEAPLVAALLAPEVVVATAAAHALARCGGVGAVPDLKEAEERGGDVRRAARAAIASIQSRLTGATPGQVSLVGGDAGQLSVVDSTDGRVSLKTDGGPR
jgi:HEAT repeat protein